MSMLTPPRLLAASMFGVSVDVSMFSSTIIKDFYIHGKKKLDKETNKINTLHTKYNMNIKVKI